jgi:hypothetical protein
VQRIPLVNSTLCAVVDDRDYAYLARWTWRLHSRGYAERSEWKHGRTSCVLMHRVVLQTPEGLETDHINGDQLDNRRVNLRMATHAENMQNRRNRKPCVSGLQYVTWDKARQLWVGRFWANGRQFWMGRFEDRHEALEAVLVKRAELGLVNPLSHNSADRARADAASAR